MGAEQQQRHASYISSALIVLMLISSLTPFVIQMTNQSDNLNEIESIAYSTSFSNGSGEQLAGETLIMNSTDWLVESVRGMDVWDETNISQSGFDHVDLTRDDRGRARACLHETTGGLWLAKLEFGGATSIESVESGTQLLGEHCSIAVDEREKLHISYTDESGFLSSAYQRVSGVWNIRTIENQTQVSALKLLLNSKGEQNIVWLDDSNSLHLSTYTTWWTHEEILPGARIGTDFDAYMGDDDSINIFYQNLDTYQIIQGIRSPNGNWSLSALTAGSELGPAVAFGEDPSTGNVQFAYASSSQAGLTIVRDLSGQENGRLSPIVETVSTGSVSDEYATKALNDMDFDCDGLDDLLVSRPAANSETGAIDIFWGSGMGISPTPDYNLSGSIGGDRFGSSFANAGDVNGDGCEDLLVGATGAVDNLGYSTGVSYLYFGGNRTYSSANWSVKGEGQNDKFGGTVSSAGDVNNDGYSDILVAATGFTQSGGEGKVYLYRGSASGPSTSKDWS
ncbi:MAG: VCBS repeat-containing protein, partial [Euryarchaeota archaeon]|nr:VCBS repeat-containing protein [Euryarchaeota archaeon]